MPFRGEGCEAMTGAHVGLLPFKADVRFYCSISANDSGSTEGAAQLAHRNGTPPPTSLGRRRSLPDAVKRYRGVAPYKLGSQLRPASEDHATHRRPESQPFGFHEKDRALAWLENGR